MKKVLFSIVIALALAAVSCAKKEVVQEQPAVDTTAAVVTDVAVDTGMTTDTAAMAVDTAVAK